MVIKDATPLTPSSTWAELFFRMLTTYNIPRESKLHDIDISTCVGSRCALLYTVKAHTTRSVQTFKETPGYVSIKLQTKHPLLDGEI